MRLWLGFDPDRSGVFSAGNGAAMRSSILGVAISDLDELQKFIRVTYRITHTDPKAEYGAFAIALAARSACQHPFVSGDLFLHQLEQQLGVQAAELIELIELVVNSVKRGNSTLEFAAELGLSGGVSGYVYHSVPIAIHAWLSHQNDFRSAIIAVVKCGGDTDSVAAMVGGIVGASGGKKGIPAEWLQNVWEPARSIEWMENLSMQLTATIETGIVAKAIHLPIAILFIRNIFFLFVVLFHGFRRLLPPY